MTAQPSRHHHHRPHPRATTPGTLYYLLRGAVVLGGMLFDAAYPAVTKLIQMAPLNS